MQLNAIQVREALPWNALIQAIQQIFSRKVHSPIRHHHTLKVPQDSSATLLLMPAWIEGEYLGVKQVNVFPGNNARNIPGLSSFYLLSCGKTGQPLAQLDGNQVTALRTAAASALASQYLSRKNSTDLLMVGAGRMGRNLIPAHMSVRPIKTVRVWDRNDQATVVLVEELKNEGINAIACSNSMLEEAVRLSDIVSCATMSEKPLVLGEWLKPGSHLDLVGSFTPNMRETNNAALQQSSVFVDTRAGALSETGELIIPICEGAFSENDIVAEFSELCGGIHLGREELEKPQEAITLFKSVGDSREDLAAAILAYETLRDSQ